MMCLIEMIGGEAGLVKQFYYIKCEKTKTKKTTASKRQNKAVYLIILD